MEWNREDLKISGYERVVFAEERDSGLKAMIAVHNTALGPACGGVRMLPYSGKKEALEDVLRLARGMTYKSSIAGIKFGGGKSVILGDISQKSPALFQAMGEFVDSLGGLYIAAKDMNILSEDLAWMKKKTKHVLGIEGEPGTSGDPSPVTARGLFRGLEATWEALTGSKNLSGIKIAIQGVGHVGYAFAELVKEAGAEIWASDTDPGARKRAQALGAHIVEEEEIFELACDVFSPNARGAVLNPGTIGKLKCKAVVGAANNQLLDDVVGLELHKKGILYAPDVAVNSGGIINIYVEYLGYDQEKAFQMADGIYGTVKQILIRAREKNVPPFMMTNQLAEERIAST